MGQNQRISQLQDKNTILRDGDLFYVSEKQKYGDYISKHISYGKTIESIRNSLSDEIDLINDINENYLDDRQVDFTFNREQNTLEFNTGLQILSVDVSDFIESGMIEKVEYKKPNLIITFRLSTGGTKEVKIDISKIIILEEGHAISVDGKMISVKPDVISSDFQNIFAQISLVSSISTTLDTKVDNSITSLTSTISSVSSFIEDDLNKQKTELTGLISSVSAIIEGDISKTRDDLTGVISTTSSALDTKIDNSVETLTNLISSVSVDIEDKIPTYPEISVGINLSNYSLSSHNHNGIYVEIGDTEYKNETYGQISSGINLSSYSKEGHKHGLDDITDISELSDTYVQLNDPDYKNQSYSEISAGISLSDYSKIGHTHAVSEVTDITSNYYDKTECNTNFLSSDTFIPSKTSDLSNDSKFVSGKDFGLEYSQSDSKLSLSVGQDTVLIAEIQSGSGGKTYTAGRGIVLSGDNNTVINTAEEYTTYENVKNNISNDFKPIWIYDWTI